MFYSMKIWLNAFTGLVAYQPLVGYLMPNPFYAYILNIWFLTTFSKEPELFFFLNTKLNGFTYFYLIWIILFTIDHLSAHNWNSSISVISVSKFWKSSQSGINLLGGSQII